MSEQQDASGPSSAVGSTPAAAARPTILIAEDTSNVRRILVHILEQAGYQTVQAKDGSEALMLLGMQRFDLVLLDIMMPGKDGYAVCQELRAQSKTRSLPVVMVTARGSKEAVLQAVRSGADDYIVKPFTKEVLLGKVEKVLQRASEREKTS